MKTSGCVNSSGKRGNIHTVAARYRARGEAVPSEYLDAIRRSKIRGKRRSDVGKKRGGTAARHGAARHGTVQHVGGSTGLEAPIVRLSAFDEILVQLADIARWEEWEIKKAKREKKTADARKLRNKNYYELKVEEAKIKTELNALNGSGEIALTAQQINNKKISIKALKARLSIIPKNLKCPECKCVKSKSKQWVVDVKNKTAICRMCYGKRLKEDNLDS